VLFHVIMEREGQDHTWLTGVYWTLTTMSTLGYGDIAFHGDLGRLFSIVVLLSGFFFMLVLLPFAFIEFFYAPWMKAQEAGRIPHGLPEETRGHVILTRADAVTRALITKLVQYRHPYVLLSADFTEAQSLHDEGFNVVTGMLDDPETYRRVRVDQAALVVATGFDVPSTNVVFTVRETSERVPVIAAARSEAGQEVLKLAGCTHVLRLGETMGQFLARRVVGGDAMTHVVGRFGELLIAETLAVGTPLVGKTLAQARLRESTGLSVVGLWDRGVFHNAQPESSIMASSVLLLAGSKEQLARYDELFCIYHAVDAPSVIVGGGRVGRATARALRQRGIQFRIIEKLQERVRDPKDYLVGDAANPRVLREAGVEQSPAVVITTHEDDLNIYLTILCRRMRPDIQIVARATHDRNVSSLHRAGADIVVSYASLGANTIFNLLERGDILMLAEGLNVVKVKMPEALAGKSIAECNVRQETGCTIVALDIQGRFQVNPDPHQPLPPDAELVLIGTPEAEQKFLERYSGD
jgi:voltage-gated potassium channel